jgi:predicted kinase
VPTLYLICGLSFAGKSTLAAAIAERTAATIVSLDEINARRGLHGGLGIPDEEWLATHRQALREVGAALAAGRSVVVDDTNCFRFLRDDHRAVAAERGAASLVIHVDVPLAEALARLRANDRHGAAHQPLPRPPVTEAVLLQLAQRFEPPAADEATLVFPPATDPVSWVRAHVPAG